MLGHQQNYTTRDFRLFHATNDKNIFPIAIEIFPVIVVRAAQVAAKLVETPWRFDVGRR
jgi:hypothetical protein